MAAHQLLDVELDVTENVVCVRADGKIDLSTAHILDDVAVTAWLLADAPDGLILDLRNVTLCDATGLQALDAIWETASARGVPCEVMPSHRLRWMILAAGADHLLADDLPDALSGNRRR